MRVLEVAGCHGVTDEGLTACPAGLTTLSLVLCESVTGKVLPRFRQLSRLRVVKCRKVSLQAIQVRCLPLCTARLASVLHVVWYLPVGYVCYGTCQCTTCTMVAAGVLPVLRACHATCTTVATQARDPFTVM